MAVIGTVSLDDETIEQIAAQVVVRLQTVNPPEQNTHRTQTAPVSETDDSGWSAEPPAPEPTASGVPTCAHGEMRYVKAGFSKRTNKAYGAFYGCPAPQGQPQCKSVQA